MDKWGGAANFTEEIKQWTNLHGLSQTPTYTDSPQPGHTRTRYGGSGGTAPVEAISMQGVPHPAGQTITGGWNASYAPASGAVTARNVAYNATIAPNASVSIGFQATHTGNTGRPTSFTLNGSPCAVA